MDNNFNESTYSKDMPTEKGDVTRIKFILKNIEDKFLDILDLGCWDGTHSVRYKKTTNNIFGIESSKTSAEKARKRGVIVEQGYFPDDRLFKNKKFDVIVAGEIIEHVFDTDEFLVKIKEKLNKNGRLIITTPNVASLPRRILLFFGINPMLDFRAKGNVAGHIRYFTFDNLRDLLEENGFIVVQEESDVVNFSADGKLNSKLIPKINKKFGRTIMIMCKLNEL